MIVHFLFVCLTIMSSIYTSRVSPISSLKKCMHHPMVCFTCVLQVESHYIILVVGLFSPEGGFLSILHVHMYMIVTGVCIHEW